MRHVGGVSPADVVAESAGVASAVLTREFPDGERGQAGVAGLQPLVLVEAQRSVVLEPAHVQDHPRVGRVRAVQHHVTPLLDHAHPAVLDLHLRRIYIREDAHRTER